MFLGLALSSSTCLPVMKFGNEGYYLALTLTMVRSLLFPVHYGSDTPGLLSGAHGYFCNTDITVKDSLRYQTGP